jgi:hypothetical protein
MKLYWMLLCLLWDYTEAIWSSYVGLQ